MARKIGRRSIGAELEMACSVHLVPLDTPLSVAMGQMFSFNVIGAS